MTADDNAQHEPTTAAVMVLTSALCDLAPRNVGIARRAELHESIAEALTMLVTALRAEFAS